MAKYCYNGPVMVFGQLVGNWKGETWADTKEKALSNLKYQFKKQTNRGVKTVVDFPGTIKRVD